MNLAEVFKYTIKDYELWEGDWELIDGYPIAMAPSPFGSHQGIMSDLIFILKNNFNKCKNNCYVYAELDWIINDFNVVRPDISVICKKIRKHLKEIPDMVIEIVSESSVKQDEIVKFNLYKNEGVKIYMIVSIPTKKIRVFKLKDSEYIKIADSEDFVSFDFYDCKIEIDAKKLWEYL
jgi:Uma2 family endonuclease